MAGTTVNWKDDSERNHEILFRFEKAFAEGKNPQVKDYLQGDGPSRWRLLIELLHSNLELCIRASQTLRVLDYLKEYSELAQHPDDLASLLKTEIRCLRQMGIHPMLQKYQADYGAILGKRIEELFAQESRGTREAKIGSIIAGKYKLLAELGEGGMGSVYAAEQTQPVRRTVAVKLIKPGMDSSGMLARFEAERQALAMMDHPNIARMLDGGITEDGQPYFVMEQVKGLPITKFCDQEKLSLDDRLQLFIAVCQGVQHAHQKGIIHRDLKPSNILVTLVDGKPVPKVIDFGVAKALHQKLTDRTMYTEAGRMVGTLEYMAPEQADLNNLDVDTRADVYALGVVLYELLTGQLPFTGKELRSAAYDEMLRIIREMEPPRPSIKLSTSLDLPKVAALRQVEPKHLTSVVAGELDWIVMKCLEKERSRRYETANALGRELGRYLANEPVEARPPSMGYRLGKFVLRNRGKFVAAVLILGALLTGLAASLWQMNRAIEAEILAKKNEQQAKEERDEKEKQRKRAEEERDIALSVRKFLNYNLLGQMDYDNQVELLTSMGNSLDETEQDPRLSKLLERASYELETGRIDKIFPNKPLVQAELLQTVGNLYRSIGGKENDKFQLAIKYLERAVALRERTLGLKDPDTLEAQHSLALTLCKAGNALEGIELFQKVLSLREQKLGLTDLETMRTLNDLAMAYMQIQKTPLAVQLLERLRTQAKASVQSKNLKVFIALNNLADAYRASNRLDDALRLLEDIHNQCNGNVDPEHPIVFLTKYNLGRVYLTSQRPKDAKGLFEQVYQYRRTKYGDTHPDTLNTLNDLAMAVQATGDLSEAIQLLEQVVKARDIKQGPDHPQTLNSLNNLGLAYLGRGTNNRDQNDMINAASIFDSLLPRQEAQLGIDDPLTVTTVNNLARAYQFMGKLDIALTHFERAAKSIEKQDYQHQFVRRIIPNTINAYEAANKLPEAESWRRKWIRVIELKGGKTQPEYYMQLQGLGNNLLRQQKWAEAETVLRRLLDIRETKGVTLWSTTVSQLLLAEALLRQQKVSDTEPLLTTVYHALNNRGPVKSLHDMNRLKDSLERLIQQLTEQNKSQELTKWLAVKEKILTEQRKAILQLLLNAI